MRGTDIRGRRIIRSTIRKRNTDIRERNTDVRENKELVSEWTI